jgi:hypothetical protein
VRRGDLAGMVAPVAKHTVLKPVAAVVGLVGTMASIWWFALKPRRKHEKT